MQDNLTTLLMACLEIILSFAAFWYMEYNFDGASSTIEFISKRKCYLCFQYEICSNLPNSVDLNIFSTTSQINDKMFEQNDRSTVVDLSYTISIN